MWPTCGLLLYTAGSATWTDWWRRFSGSRRANNSKPSCRRRSNCFHSYHNTRGNTGWGIRLRVRHLALFWRRPMTTTSEQTAAPPETSSAAAPLPQETLQFFAGDELRARVFIDKYALRDSDGQILERTPVEMWRRIADGVASVEPTEEARERYARMFYWLLRDFRFIPGGRIMHAVGNPKRVTALNCYVLPIKDDSIEAIFEWMKEAARTYSLGGGVGGDISVLRPAGAAVNNAARTSTGSISFMALMSLTTDRIGPEVLIDRRAGDSRGVSPVKADALAFTGVKRIYRVETVGGFTVRGTGDHKVKVLNDATVDSLHGSKGWKRIDELKPGDVL